LFAVAAVVLVLVVLAVGGVALYIHSQWYVAPSNGKVAVFQGVQGSAAGIQLSHVHALTNLPVTALPQDDRDRVTNGIQASGGQSGASGVVANLRQAACALPTPTPTPSPTRTAAASPHPSASKSAAKSHPASSPKSTPKPTPRPWCVTTP
jgi:protein phosphatase